MILFFLACAAQADEMIADEPPAEIVEFNDTEMPEHPEDPAKEQMMVDMLSIELFLTDKKNFELILPRNQMGAAINQNLQKRIGLATSY